MMLRCQFDLLPQDREFLDEYGQPWETIDDGSQWVLIREFQTNKGYNHLHVTAAIRMETGYPDAELSMVYFYPALARKDGAPINRTEHTQTIDGKTISVGPATARRKIRGNRPRLFGDARHLD